MTSSLDLPTHGQAKEGEEVNEEDWPVDGHVGRAGDGAHEGDGGGLGGRVPELELCGGLAVSIWTNRSPVTRDTISCSLRWHPRLTAARAKGTKKRLGISDKKNVDTSTHQEASG